VNTRLYAYSGKIIACRQITGEGAIDGGSND
jgi:hypothetical protein